MSKNKILLTESQFIDFLKQILQVILGDASIQGTGLGNIFQGTSTPSLVSTPSYRVGDEKFLDINKKIIKGIEGGYYHPSMNLEAMGDSGETMYGIDRKHGPESKTGPGIEFWSLIDQDKAKNPKCYVYLYDPLNSKNCQNLQLGNKLVELSTKMMLEQYRNLQNKFLSQKEREIIDNNYGLSFQFFYATFNGSGYFQKFAQKFKNDLAEGITDPQVLLRKQINYRKTFSDYNAFANRITRRVGNKIEKILDLS